MVGIVHALAMFSNEGKQIFRLRSRPKGTQKNLGRQAKKSLFSLRNLRTLFVAEGRLVTNPTHIEFFVYL